MIAMPNDGHDATLDGTPSSPEHCSVSGDHWPYPES